MNKIQSSKKFILVLIALLCLLVRMGLRIAFREGVGSAAPKGAQSLFCICVPRVPFRALPSLHPGL